jgi:tRNA threonylcarbamoyladenosine biosynthesis protein TsaB
VLTLAFDTCNNIISTALLQNGDLLSQNTIYENSKQAEFLVLEIEKILQENNIWYQDLDLIATINGPGSFTAVRIGLTCAKMIKLATHKPLILLNSCEVVARKYLDEKKIIVLNDAKMDEFFGAKFLVENGKIITIAEPLLLRPEELNNFLNEDDFILCGTAKKIIGGNFRMSEEDDNIEANLVGLLGYEKFNDGYFGADDSPLYLRLPKIEKRKK